eukprot:6484165-Amphidinium_carterae.1
MSVQVGRALSNYGRQAPRRKRLGRMIGREKSFIYGHAQQPAAWPGGHWLCATYLSDPMMPVGDAVGGEPRGLNLRKPAQEPHSATRH